MTDTNEPRSRESKILDWLKFSGYLLELQVAAKFRGAGFEVGQGESYLDPETRKLREGDVNAWQSDPTPRGIVSVTFPIECKSSLNQPWVLLSSEDTVGPLSAWVNRMGSPLARQFIASVLMRHGSFARLPLMKLPPRVGFKFLKGRFSRDHQTEPDTVAEFDYLAHRAIEQTLGAAIHQTRELSGSPELERLVCDFIFPVIVVNAHHFECRTGRQGDPIIEEVSRGVLSTTSAHAGACLIDIVTESGLDAYLHDAKITRKRLFELARIYLPSLQTTPSLLPAPPGGDPSSSQGAPPSS